MRLADRVFQRSPYMLREHFSSEPSDACDRDSTSSVQQLCKCQWTRIRNDVSRALRLIVSEQSKSFDEASLGACCMLEFLSFLPLIVMPSSCVWIEWNDSVPYGQMRVGALITRKEDDKDLSVLLFVGEHSARADVYVYGGLMFPVDQDGRPRGTIRISSDLLRDDSFAWKSLGMTMFVLSLLNCKNVSLEVHHNRATRAHHKRTIGRLVFKVLKIAPSPRLTTSATHQSQVGQIRLHSVRGHFKDYRAHGLFGKLRGLYWFPEHERGDAEVGAVVKEYAV